MVAAVALIVTSTLASLIYVWCICPLDLAPDEAHYWDWSRKLDWSYYSKGPLVAWLICGSCELLGPVSVALTGDLRAAVRTPAPLFHAALLTALYVLTVGVFRSRWLGVFVVASAASLPLVRAGAVLMTIDPPFLVCWSWALVFVLQAVDRGGWGWWLGAAACTALGILAKYTMALFPPAVVGYLLFHRFSGNRPRFGRAGICILLSGAILGGLPVVIWNAQNDWVSVRHVFGQVGGEVRPGLRWLGPLEFLGGQFGMLFAGWLLTAVLATGRYRPGRETDHRIGLLWWASAPVWCLFLAASFLKSGQPNWPAPAYVGGLILAAAWLREALAGPYARSLRLGLFLSTLGAVLASLWLHFPDVMRPLLARLVDPPSETAPLPVRTIDPTARLAGWKSLAAAVDDLRTRLRAETGDEPVLVGTHWTLPGTLRFHCAGQPEVYSIGVVNGSDRHSQYDLWRPNPRDDAQVFRGRSFVIVGDIGPDVAGAFEQVEPPSRLVYAPNGVPVAAWNVWVGHGFRGFDHVDRRAARPCY